jgi:hypothetical protein
MGKEKQEVLSADFADVQRKSLYSQIETGFSQISKK